jgi:hypothetical protein
VEALRGGEIGVRSLQEVHERLAGARS